MVIMSTIHHESPRGQAAGADLPIWKLERDGGVRAVCSLAAVKMELYSTQYEEIRIIDLLFVSLAIWWYLDPTIKTG